MARVLCINLGIWKLVKKEYLMLKTNILTLKIG